MTNSLFIGIARDFISRQDNPTRHEADEVFERAKQEHDALHGIESDGTKKCKKCGFSSKSYQHYHHRDFNHQNNTPSNLEINCPFCHLCHHIGYVGSQSMGTIIYAPELAQERLNLLQIALFAAMHIANKTPPEHAQFSNIREVADQAELSYQTLLSSKSVVERNFKTSDPLDFALKFEAMSEDEYKIRESTTFSGLRLLFHPQFFKHEIAYWSNSLFAAKADPPETWVSKGSIFYKKVLNRIEKV